MAVDRYHKFLRISLLVTAFCLVFDSGLFFPVTKEFSQLTTQYLASVGSGMYAKVPPNEINTLSAQLREQQRILDAREAQLNAREIDNRFGNGASSDYSTYILSAILLLQTMLIVTNYAFDFIRAKRLRYG